MQKAPDWKGTGLVPIKPVTAKNESGEEKIHVFGKNLEERVKTDNDNKDNTSSPLLFQFGSSLDTSESSQKIQDEDIETIKKRKFEAITGEEDETTVFQGDFKLFCWDLKTSNWIERGRGQLKLNDSAQDDVRRSRLIMRLGGTYRIILNVSINHPHFKVITNSKSNIRFTDGHNLWAASGQNAQTLKVLIEKRIDIPKITNDTQGPPIRKSEKPDCTPDTKKAKVLPEDEVKKPDDDQHKDKPETNKSEDDHRNDESVEKDVKKTEGDDKQADHGEDHKKQVGTAELDENSTNEDEVHDDEGDSNTKDVNDAKDPAEVQEQETGSESPKEDKNDEVEKA